MRAYSSAFNPNVDQGWSRPGSLLAVATVSRCGSAGRSEAGGRVSVLDSDTGQTYLGHGFSPLRHPGGRFVASGVPMKHPQEMRVKASGKAFELQICNSSILLLHV